MENISLMISLSNFQKKLDQIRTVNSQLENNVHRLSKDYLDLDLLDQQARKILGFAKSNEIIISFN